MPVCQFVVQESMIVNVLSCFVYRDCKTFAICIYLTLLLALLLVMLKILPQLQQPLQL